MAKGLKDKEIKAAENAAKKEEKAADKETKKEEKEAVRQRKKGQHENKFLTKRSILKMKRADGNYLAKKLSEKVSNSLNCNVNFRVQNDATSNGVRLVSNTNLVDKIRSLKNVYPFEDNITMEAKISPEGDNDYRLFVWLRGKHLKELMGAYVYTGETDELLPARKKGA